MDGQAEYRVLRECYQFGQRFREGQVVTLVCSEGDANHHFARVEPATPSDATTPESGKGKKGKTGEG